MPFSERWKEYCRPHTHLFMALVVDSMRECLVCLTSEATRSRVSITLEAVLEMTEWCSLTVMAGPLVGGVTAGLELLQRKTGITFCICFKKSL